METETTVVIDTGKCCPVPQAFSLPGRVSLLQGALPLTHHLLLPWVLGWVPTETAVSCSLWKSKFRFSFHIESWNFT